MRLWPWESVVTGPEASPEVRARLLAKVEAALYTAARARSPPEPYDYAKKRSGRQSADPLRSVKLVSPAKDGRSFSATSSN